MSHFVKVAEPDELPPGRGKVVQVEGHEVTIYNLEGRYLATSTPPRVSHGQGETTCEHTGRHFVVGATASPDRLRTGELRYEVRADRQGIWVLLEEGGHVHPGEEPRRRKRTRS